jgi:hypothetical protein
MKNIITITVKFIGNDLGTVKVLHNGSQVAVLTESGTYTINIETVAAQNLLELKPSVRIKVLDLSMFDLGQNKLVYRGVCKTSNDTYQSQKVNPGDTWELTYSYPVFSWLHHAVGYGWLVGK